MGLCIISLGVYPGLSAEEESGGRMAEVVPLFSLCFLVGDVFPCVCVFVFAVAGEPARSFSARVFCGRRYSSGGWSDDISAYFVYGFHGKDDFLLSFS